MFAPLRIHSFDISKAKYQRLRQSGCKNKRASKPEVEARNHLRLKYYKTNVQRRKRFRTYKMLIIHT